MALRQMGIARMGNYRPKHDAVQKGGKTGRPKLLHNGTGHGLTGGGGLNAKGTGGGIKVNQAMKPMQRQLRKSKYAANKFNAMKINEREKNQTKRAAKKTATTGGPAMNPHPVGAFQYGYNQWGNINALGKVDWTYQKPAAGTPVIGFHQALPWLQRTPHMRQVAQQQLKNRATRPAFYMDPIYAGNKSNLTLARDREFSDVSHLEKQNEFDYTTALDKLQSSYGEAEGQANAAIGGGNAAGSGMSANVLGKLASDLGLAKTQNQRQRDLQVVDAGRRQELATTEHDAGLAIEEQKARERWAATHQGQKAPVVRKPGESWVEGGIRYRLTPTGQQVTVGSAAKPKVKQPKFKSFKTFTAGNGQLMNRGGQ